MKQKALCAVQMNWSAEHYRSREAFEAKIRSLLDKCPAKSENLDIMAAFPEDVGTPLVLMDSPDWVFRAGSLRSAIIRLAVCYAAQTLKYKLSYRTGLIRSLILARADTAAKAYFETFSGLAREYGIYLAAGSILLPDIISLPDKPWERGNTYQFNLPDVYNICFLFGPDGRIMGYQKKVYLVPDLEDEKGFDIVSGSLSDLKVFDSPFGKLGIAVCLDGFKADVLQRLVELGANILIQPSANSKPWNRDEQEGWMKSVWTAVDSSGFAYAMNPMMTGCLYDLCFEGQSSILEKNYTGRKTGYSALQPVEHFVKIAEGWNSEEIITVFINDIE